MNLSDWNAAADVRGTGKRVPRHVADDDVIRYVSGVDPDGEPLTRLEVRGRVAVPRETDEQRELRRAIEGWGRAMRERLRLAGRMRRRLSPSDRAHQRVPMRRRRGR